MPGNAAQHNPTDTQASCNLVSSPAPDFLQPKDLQQLMVNSDVIVLPTIFNGR